MPSGGIGISSTDSLTTATRTPSLRYGTTRPERRGSNAGGGTLVFVALPAENHIELPIFETVLNGITVVGSIVGTRVDLREVFELHAAGKTRVIRETRSFADVNEAIADVEAGRVPARIVFTPERSAK